MQNSLHRDEPACIDRPTPRKDAPERRGVSTGYKLLMGGVSVLTTVGVVQNIDEFAAWENARTDNYYPSAPPVCEGYVDRSRDLSEPLPAPEHAISGTDEAKTLLIKGKPLVFLPDVTLVESKSEEFSPDGIDIGKTFEQVRTFFDHKIDTFILSSGLEVNIFSSTDSPSFTIDKQRFDELFHASFNSAIAMGDQHYRELLTCMQQGTDLPQSQSGASFDIFILPETGYCIADLRYFKVPKGANYDCVASAGTPPRLKFDLLTWSPLDEEFMLLSTKGGTDLADANRRINRLLVHEAVHYWLNQMGGTIELGPEERYVKALEMTMFVLNIADINNPAKPAITYSK